MVLVEVEGVEYPRNQQGGPILPAFKTAEFSQDQLDEIMKFLAPYEANLTNGPVFRDYAMPAETVAAPGKTVEEQSAQESVPPEGVAVSKNREWTMKSGEKIEAELITQVGTRITLENLHGRQVTLAEDQFSEEDLKLIALLIPPTLEMEFSKKSTQRTFPETHSMQLPKASFYDFTARIKQTSRRPYPHPLTAEVFAIGEEVDGDNMILLDYKKESFHLPEGSQSVVEIAGSRTVQLMEYYLNDYLRGEKYGGYLIVITDARSEIIAHKGTSEKFFQNLDNLRRVPVGRYFDKDCNRCTPTRPKKWY
jgi:hypothetical protein